MNQDHAKCPSCDERGKGVATTTVKALIREQNLVASHEDTELRFCSTQGLFRAKADYHQKALAGDDLNHRNDQEDDLATVCCSAVE